MVAILLVDDSATDRARIAGLLAQARQHTVITANDGSEALRVAERKTVDLVLTDLLMPEVGGLELVRRLKLSRPHLPVILMTGAGSEEVAVQAMQEGAASYVNKGTAATWLSENIDRVLSAWHETTAGSAILSHLQHDEYEFTLGNSRYLMSATARFLRQVVQRSGICSHSSVPRIGVALEEALLNACLHGNLELDSRLREGDGEEFERLVRVRTQQEPWMSRQVQVFASVTTKRMEVRIQDEGPGFDPTSLPDPTDPENLFKPHGRGIVMMRLFLDDVIWNERGNCVTLIKQADHQKPSDSAATV
ncbi:MAG: ATP-binding protein [Planctomycetaceae bacterium]|nr:ATP-binding protein [Planctomycetaceae bacterium]